ncbi:nucleotide sugar dehydrogenase, partial [Halobium palmae]
AGEEFTIGYAPERMSPGDDAHALRHVAKVVGAEEAAVRERLVALFERVMEAPVSAVPSIEACEAAKCLENVQRDVNIALMNEFAMACDGLPDVDPETVLDAAETKWNFHRYRPGLVDGHCIPVDPYYLIHRFEEAGESPTLMRAARTVNDRVATHVVDTLCGAMAGDAGESRVTTDGGSVPAESAADDRRRVLAVGLTYKPEVADLRAPTTRKAVAELDERGFDVVGYDPHADPAEAAETFDIPVQESFDPAGFDAMVVFTGHRALGRLDLGWL